MPPPCRPRFSGSSGLVRLPPALHLCSGKSSGQSPRLPCVEPRTELAADVPATPAGSVLLAGARGGLLAQPRRPWTRTSSSTAASRWRLLRRDDAAPVTAAISNVTTPHKPRITGLLFLLARRFAPSQRQCRLARGAGRRLLPWASRGVESLTAWLSAPIASARLGLWRPRRRRPLVPRVVLLEGAQAFSGLNPRAIQAR